MFLNISDLLFCWGASLATIILTLRVLLPIVGNGAKFEQKKIERGSIIIEFSGSLSTLRPLPLPHDRAREPR